MVWCVVRCRVCVHTQMVKMLVTKHTEFHKTLEEVEYKTFKTNINARDNKVGHGSPTAAAKAPSPSPPPLPPQHTLARARI